MYKLVESRLSAIVVFQLIINNINNFIISCFLLFSNLLLMRLRCEIVNKNITDLICQKVTS